jgi:hypothetical protein
MSEFNAMIRHNPISLIDGILHVDGLGDGGPRPLFYPGGNPVKELLPDWRADLLFTGFAPIYLLELSHVDGQHGTWYLNSEGYRLGGGIAELEPLTRGLLGHLAINAVGALWRSLMQERYPTVADPMVAALLMLHPITRLGLAELCQVNVGPKVLQLPLEQMDPEIRFHHRGRILALQKTQIASLLHGDYQDFLLNGFRRGVIKLPNPLEIDEIPVSGAIVFDDFHFAYRLSDFKTGLVIFLFVMGHSNQSVYIYIPSLDLAIGTAHGLAISHYFIKNMATTLFHHVMFWAPQLSDYFRRSQFELATVTRGVPGAHLGHQLWNELTGLEALTLALPPDHLPRCIVTSAQEDIEFFGKIEEIFPEFVGKIDRSVISASHLIPICYEGGICPSRVTRLLVSRHLRHRLVSLLHRTLEYEEIARYLSAKQPAASLVLVIGIRVENRTAVDLPGFLTRLLQHIASRAPGVIVVIDGHNSRGKQSGKTIESHMEGSATKHPVDVERELVATLTRALQNHPIEIIDNIGGSVADSLAWADLAHGFIAFWGAGLAKYRWVVNKTGFIITSRMNLGSREDIRIYDHPTFMEDPSPVTFVDANSIVDDPTATQLAAVYSDPYYSNFHVNEPMVFEQIDALLNVWLSGF